MTENNKSRSTRPKSRQDATGVRGFRSTRLKRRRCEQRHRARSLAARLQRMAEQAVPLGAIPAHDMGVWKAVLNSCKYGHLTAVGNVVSEGEFNAMPKQAVLFYRVRLSLRQTFVDLP